MQRSHGVGYAEYSRKLDKRLQVEKEREKDYQASKDILRDINQHR
ncbi:hypothetical protein ABEW33_06405 [Priestia megaterium]|nr:hypothetical protein [Priestia megaterium]